MPLTGFSTIWRKLAALWSYADLFCNKKTAVQVQSTVVDKKHTEWGWTQAHAENSWNYFKVVNFWRLLVLPRETLHEFFAWAWCYSVLGSDIQEPRTFSEALPKILAVSSFFPS